MSNLKAIDPVCGMTIPTTDAITHEYEGVNYHLCSAICASRFDIDAAAYVAVSRLGLEGMGTHADTGLPVEAAAQR
jgi:YHS domain-containing protein